MSKSNPNHCSRIRLEPSKDRLWNCCWSDLLKTEFTRNLLSNGVNFKDLTITTDESPHTILTIGIAALLAFTQDNFTGPNIDETVEVMLDAHWPKTVDSLQLLIVDGEELNINVRKPELLLLCKIIFEYLLENEEYDYVRSLIYFAFKKQFSRN